MRFSVTLLLAGALVCAMPALASTSPSATSSNDDAFIRNALRSGTSEIKLAAIQADSSDTYVHNFANKMVADHSAANSELLSLARSLNVTVPNAVVPAVPESASPAPLNGQPERSKALAPVAYFEKEAADHQKAIVAFQSEISGGSNARVRSYASKTLPILQSHLALAEKYLKIEKSIKH